MRYTTFPDFTTVGTDVVFKKFLGNGTTYDHYVKRNVGSASVAGTQMDQLDLKNVIRNIQVSAEKVKELQRNCSGVGSLAPTNGISETCTPKIQEQIRGYENAIYKQIGDYLKFGGGLSVGAGAAVYDEIMGIGSDVVELADGTTLMAFEKNLGALKAEISAYIVNGQIDYAKIKNSLVTGTSAIEKEIGTIITVLPGALAALDSYTAGYYTGKIGGGIVLEFVNPVKKAKLLTKGFSAGRWMDEARVVILANKYGKGVIGKLDTIHDMANSKLGKYADEFRGRMGRMDDYMLNEYLNNPDKYIDAYRKGGKYNSLRQMQNETNCNLCYKELGPIGTTGNGKLKNAKGQTITGQSDFVIINGELSVGKGHSIISNGSNVEYAGQLQINNNGIIVGHNNGSGHYRPSPEDNVLLIKLLKDKYQIDASSLPFTDFSTVPITSF